MPEPLWEQRPNVEKYLKDSPDRLASFSFINIFAWQDFFQFDFEVIEDCLCVFARNEIGTFLYLPPLGKNVTSEVIETCFDMMEKANKGSGVTRIENVGAKHLPCFPEKEFARYNKGYEYCYYRQDIAALRGNLYKSKRSSYNQCINGYSQHYLPYEEGMMAECLDLYRAWAKGRAATHPDDIYCHMLEDNQRVHERVLRYSQPLGLIGRVVKIDHKVRAYSFGFPINQEMFCILFEVADLSRKGLGVYMFSEFCRDAALQPYLFINAMDDLGMEHIREAKMSFHPSVLLPAYVVTKRK
jgi:uncharacterized protein